MPFLEEACLLFALTVADRFAGAAGVGISLPVLRSKIALWPLSFLGFLTSLFPHNNGRLEGFTSEQSFIFRPVKRSRITKFSCAFSFFPWCACFAEDAIQKTSHARPALGRRFQWVTSFASPAASVPHWAVFVFQDRCLPTPFVSAFPQPSTGHTV